MPFANPIIGGGGSLVYPSIHSPQFVTGSTGWTINKDGSVEFNNGTFRGTVLAGALVGGTVTGSAISGGTITGTTITGTTFDGTNFIFNTSGLFVYSGTPATGNLVYSIAPANGTDSFGNTYFGPGPFYYSTSGDGGYIGFSKTNTGQVVMFIGNTAHDGTNHASAGFMELTVGTINFGWSGNGGQVSLSAGNPGFFTVASPMFANGGTPANPTLITTDSWNAFSLVGSTVAGTDINGTTYTPSYMLKPDGDVKLKGVVKTGAGGLASGTTWAVIPAAYRPVTNIPIAVVSNASFGTQAHVYIRPNGNVQFDAALGAGVSMLIDCTLNINGT